MTLDNLLDCRVAAIDSLGELKPDDHRILQVLVEGMDNDLPAVRLASLDALRKITGKNFGVDPKPWREYVEAKTKSTSAATATVTASKPGAGNPPRNDPASAQAAQAPPTARSTSTPRGN